MNKVLRKVFVPERERGLWKKMNYRIKTPRLAPLVQGTIMLLFMRDSGGGRLQLPTRLHGVIAQMTTIGILALPITHLRS
jgi:hypothetical protein